MRVGVFVPDVTGSEGGAFSFQADVLQALYSHASETRHHFVVFGAGADLEQRPNITTVQFPGTLTGRLAGRIARLSRRSSSRRNRLDQLARHHEVDLMWFVGAEGLQLDIPYVATVWDLQHRLQPWFPEVSSDGKWRRREMFLSEFLSRAAAVVVGTQTGADELDRFYAVPAQRVRILPHPTPDFALRASKEIGPRRADLPADYIFYPAQFWPHKNHATILRAVKLLKEKCALSFDAVFVGADKGNLDYIKRLAVDLGIAEQVHFLGYVSREELTALYQHAFALVYPSYFGPENLPPLEAFALGCPVIAADVAGAREQLANAAILVDPSSADAIANAVQHLRDVPSECSCLIERGALRAARWTGSDFVRGIFSIVDEFALVRQAWH